MMIASGISPAFRSTAWNVAFHIAECTSISIAHRTGSADSEDVANRDPKTQESIHGKPFDAPVARIRCDARLGHDRHGRSTIPILSFRNHSSSSSEFTQYAA